MFLVESDHIYIFNLCLSFYYSLKITKSLEVAEVFGKLLFSDC